MELWKNLKKVGPNSPIKMNLPNMCHIKIQVSLQSWFVLDLLRRNCWEIVENKVFVDFRWLNCETSLCKPKIPLKFSHLFPFYCVLRWIIIILCARVRYPDFFIALRRRSGLLFPRRMCMWLMWHKKCRFLLDSFHNLKACSGGCSVWPVPTLKFLKKKISRDLLKHGRLALAVKLLIGRWSSRVDAD